MRRVSSPSAADEMLALMAESRSGKSTLLQLMAALDVPTAGELAWPALGEGKPLRPGHVGVVVQAASLILSLSAVENVEVPLRILAEHPDPRAAALDGLKRVGLADVACKLPDELSGGQAQRVGVARATVTHPRLVLADGPTGPLEQATAQRGVDASLESLQGTDAALVPATYDEAVAAHLATRGQIDHGRLALPLEGGTT